MREPVAQVSACPDNKAPAKDTEEAQQGFLLQTPIYERNVASMLNDGHKDVKTEDRYLIEREGQPMGMIVSEPHGFVVYACAKQIWPLDRTVFPSLDDAERQISRYARKSP